MKQLILILLIIFALFGCECVPDVNAPKQIDPEESAKVAFINVHDNYSSLLIESDDIEIIGELINFQQESQYRNLASGITYIKIVNNENNHGILNFSVDLEIGEYYSLFIFGSGSRAEALLIEDSKIYQNSVRFVNLASIYDRNLKFEVKDHPEYSSSLASRDFSEEIEVSENQYNITIRESLNGSQITSLVTEISGYTSLIAYGNNLNDINSISVKIFE
jgi:hypothetical protein